MAWRTASTMARDHSATLARLMYWASGSAARHGSPSLAMGLRVGLLPRLRRAPERLSLSANFVDRRGTPVARYPHAFEGGFDMLDPTDRPHPRTLPRQEAGWWYEPTWWTRVYPAPGEILGVEQGTAKAIGEPVELTIARGTESSSPEPSTGPWSSRVPRRPATGGPSPRTPGGPRLRDGPRCKSPSCSRSSDATSILRPAG